VKLVTHLHLVRSVRMSGDLPAFPPVWLLGAVLGAS
jgi:hypothetical protein